MLALQAAAPATSIGRANPVAIAFFLLFQRGGPLSAVPAILAGGAAIMALAGILFFHEAPSWQRVLGIALAITGLFLLRK